MRNKTKNNKIFFDLNENIEELMPVICFYGREKIEIINLDYNFKEISSKLNRHRSSIKKVFQAAIDKIRESYNG